MPQLENLRHEQFCRAMLEAAKQGLSQGAAYSRVYKTVGRAADTAASRLLKNEDIRRRLAELAAPAERRARLSAADAIERLDRVYVGALGAEQFSAAGRAAEVQSKISGLMIDKVEIGGPGSFDQCTSAEQVIDKLLSELPIDEALKTCDTMRAMIEARASNAAVQVLPVAPSKRPSEASAELLKTLL